MIYRLSLLVIIVILLIFVSYSCKKELFKDSKKEYVTYNINIKAGLSHQRSNLITMIKEAYFNKQKLIIPEFYLVAKHNNNNELKTDLSEYYDYSKLTIDGKPYKVYFMKDKSINSSDIKEYKVTKDLVKFESFIKYNNVDLNIDLPYNKNILSIANNKR